jgi:hypothetical protein
MCRKLVPAELLRFDRSCAFLKEAPCRFSRLRKLDFEFSDRCDRSHPYASLHSTISFLIPLKPWSSWTLRETRPSPSPDPHHRERSVLAVAARIRSLKAILAKLDPPLVITTEPFPSTRPTNRPHVAALARKRRRKGRSPNPVRHDLGRRCRGWRPADRVVPRMRPFSPATNRSSVPAVGAMPSEVTVTYSENLPLPLRS